MTADLDATTRTTWLTIAEAAERLGVSASTLRNWDRAGKLPAHRHPMNGYRLYEQAVLEDLARLIAPRPNSSLVGDGASTSSAARSQ